MNYHRDYMNYVQILAACFKQILSNRELPVHSDTADSSINRLHYSRQPQLLSTTLDNINDNKVFNLGDA